MTEKTQDFYKNDLIDKKKKPTSDSQKVMSPAIFAQYKKIADEFCKLFRMAGTRYLDTIQSTMTDEQYNKIKNHPCFDNVYI